MSDDGLLDTYIGNDPTWHYAYHFVRKNFDVPSHMYRLFRSGWAGDIEPIEYVKVLGFSRLNPRCLISAAEISGAEEDDSRGSVERAIHFLGIRYSAIILAIHLYCRLILKKKPALGWRSFLEEMMTNVEMGYRFGTHATGAGIEGGMLCGFAPLSGLGLVMAADQERYKLYQSRIREKEKLTPKDEVEIFGCELYQLSAMIVQQLGFGTDIAFGIALASGRVDRSELKLSEHALLWEAVYQWIDALKNQRNYPREESHRKMFPEITPPPIGSTERNRRLETLYTDINKLMKEPSEWMWHLPKENYDETRKAFDLP